MTLIQAILVGLVAALTYLDGAWLGEMKFREPIITGFLVGAIFGDIPHGLMIGASLQLMWMGVIGIGPTPKLDVGGGGTVGAAIALSTHTGVSQAVLFAVPVAVLLQFAHTLINSGFSAFMPYVQKKIDEVNLTAIQCIHYLCGFIAFSAYFIITFLGMYLGSPIMERIVEGLPTWVNSGLSGVSALLPALGFSLLLDVILDKKLIPFFVLGFIPAAYVGHDLSMIGISAIAIALALIMYSLYSDFYTSQPRANNASPTDNEWED